MAEDVTVYVCSADREPLVLIEPAAQASKLAIPLQGWGVQMSAEVVCQVATGHRIALTSVSMGPFPMPTGPDE